MAVLLEFYMPLKFFSTENELARVVQNYHCVIYRETKSLKYIFWFSGFEHTPLALAKLEFGYFVNSFLFVFLYVPLKATSFTWLIKTGPESFTVQTINASMVMIFVSICGSFNIIHQICTCISFHGYTL